MCVLPVVSRKHFKLECLEGGQWEETGCEPIACPAPPDIFQGMYTCTNGLYYDTVCTLQCSDTTNNVRFQQLLIYLTPQSSCTCTEVFWAQSWLSKRFEIDHKESDPECRLSSLSCMLLNVLSKSRRKKWSNTSTPRHAVSFTNAWLLTWCSNCNGSVHG